VQDGSRTHGYSSTIRFDLSKTADGHSRLTGTRKYNVGRREGATSNDTIGCGMDFLREGWWASARTGSGHGDQLCFTHRSGEITNKATPPIGLAWCTLHHFGDDDSLVAISGGAPNRIVISHPGQTWSGCNAREPRPTWRCSPSNTGGSIGFKWSTIIGCFVGMDINQQPDGDTAKVRLWKITPPSRALRFTALGTVASEVIASADGSRIDLRKDAASMNGSFGKLVECPSLRCFVWSRSVDKKGMLLRPKGT
jgi:hypothetical protein